MTNEHKDLALELAFKEIAFLRGELEAVDARARRVDKERHAAQSRLNDLRVAVLEARVFPATIVESFRVGVVAEDWARIEALVKDPS